MSILFRDFRTMHDTPGKEGCNFTRGKAIIGEEAASDVIIGEEAASDVPLLLPGQFAVIHGEGGVVLTHNLLDAEPPEALWFQVGRQR